LSPPVFLCAFVALWFKSGRSIYHRVTEPRRKPVRAISGPVLGSTPVKSKPVQIRFEQGGIPRPIRGIDPFTEGSLHLHLCDFVPRWFNSVSICSPQSHEATQKPVRAISRPVLGSTPVKPKPVQSGLNRRNRLVPIRRWEIEDQRSGRTGGKFRLPEEHQPRALDTGLSALTLAISVD
jgi:hypothetical protein